VPSQYPTIQAGIDAAQPGDTVIVAKGTYTGAGNYNLDFHGKAITVQSENGPYNCMIDCEDILGHRGFTFQNNEGNDSIVRGFTITRGYKYTGGAAISMEGSSPTITDCFITGNRTIGIPGLGDAYGGAISCVMNSNPIIRNCVINNNVAKADIGPFDNGSDGEGGGLHCSFNSNVIIENCIVHSNKAIGGESLPSIDYWGGDGKGGGIFSTDDSHLVIRNCLLYNNSAIGGYNNFSVLGRAQGGAIFGSHSISNCTIVANILSSHYSSKEGYGVYSNSGSTITDSILWENSNDDVAGTGQTVTYSCIQEPISGIGNIFSDPRFVAGPFIDYHLSQIAAGQAVQSPCVDAGSDTAANLGMDILTTRTDGIGDAGIVDMGYHCGLYCFPQIPLFEISPNEFSFYKHWGDPDPAAQILYIRNIGAGTLNWEITEDCPWLNVTPTSGKSSGEVNEVTISVDVSGLDPGEYHCELTISDPYASNNPQTVNVELTFVRPIISLSNDVFSFYAAIGYQDPLDQKIGIYNSNGGTLNWTISHDCNWLSVEPDHGTSTGNVNVVSLSADIENLSADIYNCELTISDPNAENNPQTVEVELILNVPSAILNYDAEAYAYAHVYEGGGDSDTVQDFSINEKAQVHARAFECDESWCGPQDNYISYCQDSDTQAGVWAVYASNGASLVSTLKGWGSWWWYDECSGERDSGDGGGDGNGYTSLVGTIEINTKTIMKLEAVIDGSSPGSWDSWDWWLKIWDDDPNNPIVLLSDSNMSADLDVLRDQFLNFEFYHEAGENLWPEDGLESTVLINLQIQPFTGLDNDYYVDFFDYAWFALDWPYETLKQIPRGSVVVDGDLSDWPGSVEWIELDKVYAGSPNDVSEARFALQWDDTTDKVYAAVVVNDTSHVFLDKYVTWDASDRLEVYSQGDAEGGTGWNGIYDEAQQYYVAPDTIGGSWATWALGETLGADAGLEYAVDVKGMQIIYEVGVRQFDNYGGFSGGETLLTELHAGHIVGFDLAACTRWDTVNFGMLSENLMTGKYRDAGKFARYILVDEIFSADLDGNGANNYADLGILFEHWLDCCVTKATNPQPSKEAGGVDPNGTLGWVPGMGALYHDVYLGTDADAVANAGYGAPEFMGTVSETYFDPCGLELETMYYWRVDEVGPACMIKGEVWSFKTWLEPRLISWWKFDEGTESTAYDSVGNNHGTIYGATWATGQLGGALSFDGYNDYVDMIHPGPLGNSPRTIVAWAKTSSSSGQMILSYGGTSGQHGSTIRAGLSAYGCQGVTFDISYGVVTYSATVADGIWHHYAYVVPDKVNASIGDVELYQDGVFLDNVCASAHSTVINTTSGYAIDIGRYTSDQTQYFNGTIDDVRVYDRALTAVEILQLYQDGLN
jgi:hypothetical protein